MWDRPITKPIHTHARTHTHTHTQDTKTQERNIQNDLDIMSL